MSTPAAPDRYSSYTTPRPDVLDMVPRTAKRILDVGCSNGALGASLRNALPGCYVVGLDCDTEFAREAKDRLDEVIIADLNEFRWETWATGHQFDCIIFADVLEHLVDPARQVRDAKRLLTREGAMVISLPNVRHISAFWSIFVGGCFPRRKRGIFDETHLRWFTINDAHALVRDAGLSVEAMSYSLRLGDRGGGPMNRIVNRLPERVQAFYPVREFFAYQFCMRATNS